ncbi:MAG: hypothetical protein AABY18_02215 [Candidatus Thermoplasmatota archaeon]
MNAARIKVAFVTVAILNLLFVFAARLTDPAAGWALSLFYLQIAAAAALFGGAMTFGLANVLRPEVA